MHAAPAAHCAWVSSRAPATGGSAGGRLITSERGSDGSARSDSGHTVLIVEDNAASRTLLREFVHEVGHQPLEAAGPAEGLAALEREPGIAVLLTDVRMPHPADGVAFIRAVRARWPELPLVAVTGYPQELAELHGTPECPLLILPKPLRIRQVEEVLRLALRAASRAPFETRPGSAAPPAPGEPPPS